MSKEIYISSTPHETRLAIVENDALTEIYYERENEYTLAGSIYNGKVTRVLPGMQSSFVDIGLERDAFLYITDFMEEAGDSADFEASATGSESRAPRSDRNGGDRNGGDRNGSGRDRNGDRGGRNGRDRGEQPRLPERAAETSDSELFTQAVSGLDPARPVADGERSDRGGSRRGGRNRRDRNFNSDGTPRRERSDTARVAPVASGRSEAPSEFVPESIAAPAEQVGEAAPGADGSRRWRGRRGRRGNRSREDFAPATQAPTTGEIVSETAGYSDEGYDEPAFEVEASPVVPVTPVVVERPSREDRGGRNDRGGRDRGGRDRGDGRGDRNRGDRGVQAPPRVPRGFAPSLSLYQVDGSSDETVETPYGQEPESIAPVEPIILPGESLSKYRAGSSEPATSSRVEAASAPAADFTLPGAWDGGLVLPGETIRPRSTSASSEPSRFEDRGPRRDDRGGRNDRGGRDNRGGRGDRNDRDRGPREDRESFAARPAFQLEQPPVHHEAAAAAQGPAVIETLHAGYEQHAVEPIHSTFVPPPPMPVVEPLIASEEFEEVEEVHEIPATFTAEPAAVVEEPVHFSEEEVEFEPVEASASFRIDPAPPSEYRQSSPYLEPEVEEPAFEEASSLAEPEAAVDLSPAESFAPVEAMHEPSPVPPSIHGVPQGLRSIKAYPHAEEPAAAIPEFTSINELGEMHSEPVIAAPEPLHENDPSAPIEHGAAIVSGTENDPYRTSTPGMFAPGDGHLEEEELVDDEESLPAVHGSSFHDSDSALDQETLEGTADLGTMLREMSIDHITRTEPAELDEEDDEDLDEDFLEEDQLEDDESLESEYAEEDSPEELEAHELGEGGETMDEAEEPVYGAEAEGHNAAPAGEAGAATEVREPRRDGRRDARRDGRSGSRGRREGRGDRDRSSSSSGGFSSPGDRDRSSEPRDSRGGRNSRQSMQSTNLPAISDLLKPGQEILCQIAKEPIAKKGARITSHIALPGRFLVFMPTVHHTGVSRKIESDSERRRLKEILISERGEASGGFIVRTAAEGASEEELRSDLRFLLNLWADIKTRSESSKSPALIYHDLNLIERVLRDQVTDNFSAIWVDTETEYERVLRFLQRFQPSLIRRVKLYTKETPLFEQFGITEEINKALRSKVWLKSGGSIVINQTEALVAIDINTGKFVGKTARLEDTIVKTNLDAIPEIVRQIRLRDLGGIIIIDFIDMDERKNRNKVMAALEEELKSDRAPSKVLQFNDFGLVAITRKRVKQSLERTLSATCSVCQGTGMTKSPVSVCNDIYIEMRKMHKHLDRGDVMLRVHPEVVKQLKSSTRWLQEMEEMCGKTILVKSDPSLHPEQFDIH